MKFIFSIFFAFSLTQPASSDSTPVGDLDSRHQAMYLFNLVRYIDWDSDKVMIGIIGESPVKPELDKLTARKSNIEIQTLEDYASATNYNIVFLPNEQSTDFYLLQKEIGYSSTLLVVEKKELVAKGAEMGFYFEEDKMKFVVNSKALEETGVKVSSTLLERASNFN